jgi:purine nucleosidase
MTKVWIDTDMGFDDLAAVLTVAAQPGWQVAGMSLVAGNAPLPVVVDNALRAASFWRWEFPIHAGCAEPLACPLVTAQYVLGSDAMRTTGRSLPMQSSTLAPGHGVDALVDFLSAAPKPVPVLALGPMTNVAAALQRAPALVIKIDKLIWMGGSAGRGNHSAAAEFNASVDPEAVQVVLDCGAPLHMVGLDACRQVRVHTADAQALRAAPGDRAQVLGDLLGGYVCIAADDGSKPMFLYDPVAAVALVQPDAVQFKPALVAAELQGQHTRGMTVVEWRVPKRGMPNAMVATEVDEPAVRACVLQALATNV